MCELVEATFLYIHAYMFIQTYILFLAHLLARLPQNLAGRSVMVAKDHSCKITDFGVNRDISDSLNCAPRKLPIKWTALGVLSGVFVLVFS